MDIYITPALPAVREHSEKSGRKTVRTDAGKDWWESVSSGHDRATPFTESRHLLLTACIRHGMKLVTFQHWWASGAWVLTPSWGVISSWWSLWEGDTFQRCSRCYSKAATTWLRGWRKGMKSGMGNVARSNEKL